MIGSILGYITRYLFSGILATLVHFGLLLILVQFVSMQPVKASAAGFILAAIYNYIFQYYWSFKVKTAHLNFLSRFFCLHVLTLGINIGLFWWLTLRFQLDMLVTQLLVSAALIVLNVLVNGHYIYNVIKANSAVECESKPLISKQYMISFGRYFISGGLAVLIHFAILVLLIEVYSVYPVLASDIGFCFAVIFNYTAQYYWTFKVNGPHQLFLLRYLAVTSFTLMINTGLFWLTFDQLKLPYLVAQVIATGTVFLINFFINHHYTFNHKQVTKDATEFS